MRCAVLKAVKQLELGERDVPVCSPDELRIKIKICAVCATDVKIYNYGHNLLKLPRVLGHELAGVIDTVGKNVQDRFQPGQRIAVCAVINCGECRYCLRCIPSMCEHLEAFGYHYDGGYQEYMIVPNKAIRCGGVNVIPDNLSFEEASLAELLACAINGQNLSDFRLGESVLIIGSGPVGILHAQLAREHGCGPIFIADILPKKLEVAKTICKNALAGTIDSRDMEQFVRKVKRITNGQGFNQIMLCCSSASAQQIALEVVAKCGCVNFFGGLPKGHSEVLLDTNYVHYKQCRLVGTHGSSTLENRTALNLIARGRIQVKDLITARIDLTELETALQLNKKNASGLKSVVVLE